MGWYKLIRNGDGYTLDCTSIFFSETLSFPVDVIDSDNIEIYTGAGVLELTRIE